MEIWAFIPPASRMGLLGCDGRHPTFHIIDYNAYPGGADMIDSPDGFKRPVWMLHPEPV